MSENEQFGFYDFFLPIFLPKPGCRGKISHPLMNWLKSLWKKLSAPPVTGPRIAVQPGARSTPRAQTPTAPRESFSNFTPHAQQVLALARKEADRFNHNVIGTEHLLLGLIKLGQGVAVNVLQKMGLDLETVRLAVEKAVGTGPDQKMIGNVPYTPRVKKVLDLASREAKNLNHTYIGTEHILLGLLREGGGVAARILRELDVDIEQTRKQVLEQLDPNYRPASARTGSETPSGTTSSKSLQEQVDTSKRYDVYCTEWGGGVVVYRNAVFKGVKRLFPRDRFDIFYEFVELEQSDGQTVFLSSHSIVKFCEHGKTPRPENDPGRKP
jgi:hypothetical protein